MFDYDFLAKLQKIKKVLFLVGSLLSYIALVMFFFDSGVFLMFCGFILLFVVILDNDQLKEYFMDVFKKKEDVN